MRRSAWAKHPPVPAMNEDMMRLLLEALWVYPRVLLEDDSESAWIMLSSGKPLPLRRPDYLSDDWEVMP